MDIATEYAYAVWPGQYRVCISGISPNPAGCPGIGGRLGIRRQTRAEAVYWPGNATVPGMAPPSRRNAAARKAALIISVRALWRCSAPAAATAARHNAVHLFSTSAAAASAVATLVTGVAMAYSAAGAGGSATVSSI